MKSGAPDTARSSRASRKGSLTRRSKQSISVTKDDGPLEAVKVKWNEILEEEGVNYPITIIRVAKSTKLSPRLDIPKNVLLKIAFGDDDNPIELQAEGEIQEREALKSICSLFSSLTTITVLRLTDCKLKTEAIQTIGTYMSESGHIKELNLDLNPISGEDYSSLLENSTLEVLSLKGCAISGRGAELISDKLTKHDSHLKVLILNTNIIDDHGATALGKGLKWTNKLVCLSLAGNNIGSVGALSIFSALKEFVLDDIDLEKRRNVLFERAQLILAIVNERKEAYLSNLHPMPPLPPSDFPRSRKSRHEGTRSKKKSEIRVMSKSQRLLTSSSKMTSNGDKSLRRSAVAKKEKGRVSEQVSQLSRSHASVKQPRSSLTAFSESLVGDHEGDNETIDISDDESISDFSRFESFLAEDWDRKDNERRYKEKMLKRLCYEVGNEIGADPVFQETLLSRVFLSMTGKLSSRGNLTLSHLNLAYNKIRDDVMPCLIDMLSYQERSLESGKRRGIKVLMLEGNMITLDKLSILDEFTKPLH